MRRLRSRVPASDAAGLRPGPRRGSSPVRTGPGPDPSTLPANDPFETAAVGMAFIALDNRFLRVNQALADLFGCTTGSLIGMSCADLTHPDDQAYSDEQIAALVAGERPRLDFEKRYVRADGSILVGRVTSALTVVDGETVIFSQLHDITREANSQDAQRRFDALAACSSDAMFWIALEPELSYRYISDSMAAMTGYAVEEFYADPDLGSRVLHPDDVAPVMALMADPAAVGPLPVRWIRRDGSILRLELRMSLLAEVDGVPTDLLGVARDITERVAGDRARARHVAQQETVNAFARRCASTGDLTSSFEEAVERIDRFAVADITAIWWELEPGGDFLLAAGAGFTALEPGRSVIGAVDSLPARVRTNHSIVRLDRPHDLPDSGLGGAFDHEAMTSGIGVPISTGGRVAGAVAVFGATSARLDADDVAFLEAIAAALGSCADRVNLEEQLAYASLHDSLTGLPNRTMLLDHLSRNLAMAGDGRIDAVAVCGIDDFQLLSEALGGDASDELLRQVATRLQEIDPEAVVARTSGDMFAIIIPMGVDDVRSGTIAAEIIAAMGGPFDLGDGMDDVHVSMSVGVAAGTSADVAGEVLGHALSALHKARSGGRGRWMHASGEEQAAAIHHLELISSLRAALGRGEIRAHFQPIISLSEGRIVGYEALARWSRPSGVEVMPDEFIPIAEETGLIGDLGISILDQACAFLATLEEAGDGGLMVTVNVSSRQMDDADLPARVDEVLARYDLPRMAVCLELTESVLVPGDKEMIERLSVLKRLGLSLAIDDFGTGYSSFAYLTQFPIDLLKLDRAFVTGLQGDVRRVAVARSIITLARALGIDVLAEGIETSAEREVLAGLDCVLGQGYLWSRAVPPAEAASLMVASRTD